MTPLYLQEILPALAPIGKMQRGPRHAIVDNLRNPVFQKIITCTDQAILILDRSTLRYEYVSENISNISRISATELLEKGVEFFESRIHPDDFDFLQKVVYPRSLECFGSADLSDGMTLKFSHTYRLKRSDEAYGQILQHSIPLTFDAGGIQLELLMVSDISTFKRDNAVVYRNVLIDDHQKTRILSEGRFTSDVFTKREREILSLTASGHSEKQIADKLCVSFNTVKNHRKNMFRKSGVKTAAELVRYGISNLLL